MSIGLPHSVTLRCPGGATSEAPQGSAPPLTDVTLQTVVPEGAHAYPESLGGGHDVPTYGVHTRQRESQIGGPFKTPRSDLLVKVHHFVVRGSAVEEPINALGHENEGLLLRAGDDHTFLVLKLPQCMAEDLVLTTITCLA